VICRELIIFAVVVLFVFGWFNLHQLIIAYAIAVTFKGAIMFFYLLFRGEINLKPQLNFVTRKLRHEMINVSIFSILAGIGGRRSVGFGPNKVLSLPDAVAMALSNHYNFRVNGFMLSFDTKDDLPNTSKIQDSVKDTKENLIFLSKEKPQYSGAADICPSCGASAFVYQEGCSKCQVCGHSEC